MASYKVTSRSCGILGREAWTLQHRSSAENAFLGAAPHAAGIEGDSFLMRAQLATGNRVCFVLSADACLEVVVTAAPWPLPRIAAGVDLMHSTVCEWWPRPARRLWS